MSKNSRYSRCDANPHLEPVHRVADLIVPDRSGKSGEDAAQGVLELLRFLNELAVLEDDDQDLIPREVPDERDVFLQAVDVAKRQADGQATDVQRLDEVGNLGRRERPLVLERSFQVDAKADSMVVAKCFEPSVARQPFEKEGRPEKGDEPFPQLVPDSEPTEPSLGAPVEGRRLIGEVNPSETPRGQPSCRSQDLTRFMVRRRARNRASARSSLRQKSVASTP